LKKFLWDKFAYSNKIARIKPMPPAIIEVNKPIKIVSKKILTVPESKESAI
jgi:hypothetical protein